MGLNFDTLRAANMLRLPRFKNAKGERAHSKDDGSDWSPAEWLQAVTGELGELANMLKKVKRGDYEFEEGREAIAKEFADVAIYLDLFAYQFRIDLGKAVTAKFNEVSDRVDAGVYIANDGSDPAEVYVVEAEGRGTKVETLPVGEDLSIIDDIDYFMERILKCLKLPDHMLGSEPEPSSNWANAAKESLDRLQRTILDGLMKGKK